MREDADLEQFLVWLVTTPVTTPGTKARHDRRLDRSHDLDADRSPGSLHCDPSIALKEKTSLRKREVLSPALAKSIRAPRPCRRHSSGTARNLLVMGTRPQFSAAERAALVQAWQEARDAGEDQQSFCARQTPPISTRTLRQWSKQLSTKPESTAIGQKLEIALNSLDQILEMLRGVEALIRLNSAAAAGVPLATAAPASSTVPVSSMPTGTPPAAEAEPVAASRGSSPSCRSSFAWNEQ
mgnify:CR=1 FL=1